MLAFILSIVLKLFKYHVLAIIVFLICTIKGVANLMSESKRNEAAKLKIVTALIIAAVLFVLAVYILIMYDLHSVRRINPTDADYEKPDNFVYSINVNVQDELTVEGFAFVVGGNTYSINNFLCLYSSVEDVYYRVPTKMSINEAANTVTGERYNYSRSGFFARVQLSELNEPLEQYEICFYYKNDDYNNMVHTGKTVIEGEFSELSY